VEGEGERGRWRGTKGIGDGDKKQGENLPAETREMTNVVVVAAGHFHGGTSKRAVPGKGPLRLRGGPTT